MSKTVQGAALALVFLLLQADAFAEEGRLPPDPGSAGDVTLEGIDSDQDGIRDDVQRYILLHHPGQEDVQAALFQITRAIQDSLIDSASEEAAIEHMSRKMRGIECLMSLISPYEADTVAKNLAAKIVNTELRGKASFRSDKHIGGKTFPMRKMSEWSKSCVKSQIE